MKIDDVEPPQGDAIEQSRLNMVPKSRRAHPETKTPWHVRLHTTPKVATAPGGPRKKGASTLVNLRTMTGPRLASHHTWPQSVGTR